MRLSTKTRYGVRAMFDIAFHHGVSTGESPSAAQAKDIAKREEIPLRYLEQIFQDLKRAGLVESKRGPRGGYFLKRDPAEITLGDVVRALQGPIDEMFAGIEEEPSGAKCTRRLTGGLWHELADHVSGWFDGYTLADLVIKADDLGIPRAGASRPMYYI
ncbi:MAG: Rrf2 family transcriptional regulator [Deltaproteobacteria bacterium]|nr:Rrf2 family transcriptional regulator [Deltaproteobacteria bacterium]